MLLSDFFEKEHHELDWNVIMSIPEMTELSSCEQNPIWHAEGNAMEHTKRCVDSAICRLKNMPLTQQDRDILLVAVLLHDIGKCRTTEFLKGNWHAYGHEIEGEKIVRRLLWDEDIEIRERICDIVRYHMDVINIADSKDIYMKILRMASEPYFKWSDLIFAKQCDIAGSDMGDVRADESLDRLMFVAQSVNALGVMNDFNPDFNHSKIYGRNIDIFYDKKRIRKVHVLIGLPGAGKNYFCSAFVNGEVKLSRDDIRVELGFCKDGEKIVGTKEQEQAVTDIFEKRFVEALEQGRNVVINNINLKRKYRDGYKRLAAKFDVEWNYRYIETDKLETNIARRPMINKEAMESMTEKFEWPRGDEYDNIKIIKY